MQNCTKKYFNCARSAKNKNKKTNKKTPKNKQNKNIVMQNCPKKYFNCVVAQKKQQKNQKNSNTYFSHTLMEQGL
jgi:hypothetical protein